MEAVKSLREVKQGGDYQVCFFKKNILIIFDQWRTDQSRGRAVGDPMCLSLATTSPGGSEVRVRRAAHSSKKRIRYS